MNNESATIHYSCWPISMTCTKVTRKHPFLFLSHCIVEVGGRMVIDTLYFPIYDRTHPPHNNTNRLKTGVQT